MRDLAEARAIVNNNNNNKAAKMKFGDGIGALDLTILVTHVQLRSTLLDL